jgi:hypothetical protein
VSGPSTIAVIEPAPQEHDKPVRAAKPSDAERDPYRGCAATAANDNVSTPPIVVLHPSGDGVALYRALARVLVRRELASASEIREDAAHSAD